MKPFPVAVVEAVLAAGVAEFVVCAGARNTALIAALSGLGDKVRLWHHFDERAAAFFAVGRIRASLRPVAVVTTSGTAAAELLPAVIEAHYEGLPLAAVTADRPRSYRLSGAPQAIEQAGLFGAYARGFDLDEADPVPDFDFDASNSMGAGLPRLTPVHLNVCLEEPDSAAFAGIREAAAQITTPVRYSEPGFFGMTGEALGTGVPASAPGHAVIAGELLGKEIADAAAIIQGSGGPVYAEASSGLRDLTALKNRLIRCGEATLRHLPLHTLLRTGGVPSLRYWRDLEERATIQVINWSRSAFPGLARKQGVVSLGDFKGTPGGDDSHRSPSADDCLARDAALYQRLEQLLAALPRSEPALMRRLSLSIPEHAAVLTGNSLAIREWNLCAAYGRGHRVHVLRGANGIDGNLSAFMGLAAEEAEAWCVAGDLTALYDLNSPWILRQMPAGRRRLVVIQNGGGKIFSRLPSLRGMTDAEREMMENPHHVSLRGWADMWEMAFLSGGPEVLSQVPELPDHAVIELHPDPAETESFWEAWARAEREIFSDL